MKTVIDKKLNPLLVTKLSSQNCTTVVSASIQAMKDLSVNFCAYTQETQDDGNKHACSKIADVIQANCNLMKQDDSSKYAWK